VNPPSATLSIGDTVRFSASITGPDKCFPPGVTSASPVRWSTPDSAIAKIDSLTGLLAAQAAGTANVIVSALGNGGLWVLGGVVVEVRASDGVASYQ
jgi:uncharacterized protein YjdB